MLNLDPLISAYSASFRFQPGSCEIRHVLGIWIYGVGYQARGNHGRDRHHFELSQMPAKLLR